MTILNYSKLIHSLCRKPMFTILNQAKGMRTNIQEPKVLFEKVETAGVITFNRPKLNLTDYNVMAQLYPILQAWERTQSRVIIRGVDNFSAGGDIKWLLSPDRDPTKYAWLSTGRNNIYRTSQNRIPYIALLDGIAMGSAFMLVVHAQYKIATERTILSMPETRISWCSGAPHYLPKLDKHLGFYLGFTGKRIEGKDAVLSGIATHFVPSSRLRELEAELCHCNVKDIEQCLNAYSESLGEFSLASNIEDIDYCFSADTIEEVFARLSKLDNAWSRETLEMMAPLCPTMLKVAFRALKLGETLDLKQALRMENRMESRCIGSYNAQEGLRSLLLEKTERPKWRPLTLAEVTDAEVDSYFEPLPEGEELRFYDDAQTLYGWRNEPYIIHQKIFVPRQIQVSICAADCP